MRRRRPAHEALVACSLILVIASIICHGFAREVTGKQTRIGEDEKRATPKEASPVAMVDVPGVSLSRSNSSMAGSWRNLTAWSERKGSSLVEDDKRIVPSGSNPLHNK
ncbi:hypothetical protein Cni_G05035 [Canna indica]|uniref:Uncharacterized protein n=1 Tax=Canna indica TaxID=4628 RepID=A0AAQ3JVU0_9LILI|nr:hypothetical protein Cni_G05035 [Canna indica]